MKKTESSSVFFIVYLYIEFLTTLPLFLLASKMLF